MNGIMCERFFFRENNTIGHNCQWKRKKNHQKEVITIASRNVIAGSESRDKQPIKSTVKEFPA